MKPYFTTHPVGFLYLAALLGYYCLELGQFVRQQQWRQEATKADPPSFWFVYLTFVVVAIVAIGLAPLEAPGAAIGHGAVAFTIGMVLLVAGAALRLWSFRTLGQYFTFTVKVSPDQPVVTSGPYRVLRHPSYAGGLLAIAGIGLVNGNWVSMATICLLWLALIVWRIRVEEKALLTTLDGSYRAYASHHKRLVPLVW